eukprot:CAMPEP_0194214740 /NCGR_PEP_ID=MMETSP0156-20130528/16081_1 /TAXON_ID=33649 /ORGANISM="Thalassionema nitzschioides, Strain L26-B" /LENGTH=521 /DNA_ID=CAMNT_0038943071 /DNA_START=24 /DNA_END=1586 /DNA_ORIENTATION=+
MKRIFFLTGALLLIVSGGNAEAFVGRNSLIKNVIVRKKLSVRAVNNGDQPSVEDVPRGGGLSSLKKQPDPLPTMTDYRKFALPCLALWVAGPLLSLIDTSFVGLSGDASMSATQVAALGPATTFIDGATYLFAFLNVASTNLYSSARAQHGEESDPAESVVRTAARVAILSGIGLMILLQKFSRPLLALYIGHEAADQPNLLNWATDYVKIRAFSMPTSLLLGVLQACLLGAKDSVTPLIAVAYSTVINIFGDYICVTKLGMGLRGAAIATTLAQWASTLALLGPARKKLVRDHNLGLMTNKHKKIKAEGAVTGRSFLAFAAPVLTLILGKLAAFGFMTHSAAGLPGQPTTLASHQIILSIFFFISPFLEVISQTAQTFLPPFFSPVREHVNAMKNKDASYDVETDVVAKKWLDTALIVSTRLLGIGIVVASFIATLVSFIPAFFGNFITSDTIVQEAVKPLAKYLWAGAFLTAPVAVSEGVLLARRELPFLASVYVISTIVLPFALLEIKKQSGHVSQIW